MIRHSFHLYPFGAGSETSDKDPNIITKDVPMALIIWETTGVLGVVARKGDRDHLFTSYYKSQYHTLCVVTEGLLGTRACALLSET